MANTISFTVASNNLAYSLAVDINTTSSYRPIVISAIPAVKGFEVLRFADRLQLTCNAVMICEILISQVSAINSFNGASKSYTLLSQLESDFKAVVDAVTSGSSGGGSYSPTSPDNTIQINGNELETTFKPDFLLSNADVLNLIDDDSIIKNALYAITDTTARANSIFYTRGLDANHVDVNGTWCDGSNNSDPETFWDARYIPGDDEVTWVKNSRIEICFDVPNTLNKLDNSSPGRPAWRGRIGYNTVIAVDANALGMDADLGDNNSVNFGAGSFYIGNISNNVNPISFPSSSDQPGGQWVGDIRKFDSDVVCNIDITGAGTIDLTTLGLDSFIGKTNLSSDTQVLGSIKSDFIRFYEFVTKTGALTINQGAPQIYLDSSILTAAVLNGNGKDYFNGESDGNNNFKVKDIKSYP